MNCQILPFRSKRNEFDRQRLEEAKALLRASVNAHLQALVKLDEIEQIPCIQSEELLSMLSSEVDYTAKVFSLIRGQQ